VLKWDFRVFGSGTSVLIISSEIGVGAVVGIDYNGNSNVSYKYNKKPQTQKNSP